MLSVHEKACDRNMNPENQTSRVFWPILKEVQIKFLEGRDHPTGFS